MRHALDAKVNSRPILSAPIPNTPDADYWLRHGICFSHPLSNSQYSWHPVCLVVCSARNRRSGSLLVKPGM